MSVNSRIVALALLLGLVAASLCTHIAQEGPPAAFQEVMPQISGIHWKHDNAMSPERHLPETTGSGCAFVDYNNDGWMDLYLVNSGPSDFFTPKQPLHNALYRNNRDGTFTDVTEGAGVIGGGFGMGVAVGDYNDDGWQDLYVTNYGRNFLYRNNGDGTFSEMAKRAGVECGGWSASSVWFDFDGDRRLDLFVAGYVHYEKALSRLCNDEHGRPRYCIPRLFKPAPSRLFHNNGDGTFTDVSQSAGISASLGKAFGVVATDVNNDRLLDLFVANDMVANFLFVNRGKGKFDEVGLFAGVGYSEAGAVRSGMGCDAVDFNADGWQDLFVANVNHQKFSLYENRKDLTFAEASPEIGKATFFLSGWGLRFFDYDNDGDPDLMLANGHPDDKVEEVESDVKYKEPLLLFQNSGGVFRDVSHESGPVFGKSFAARGLAAGDADNDGDLDVLISVSGDAPLLLLNQVGSRNHWLGLQLMSRKSDSAVVGAKLVWEAGGKSYQRLRTAGGSYLSYHDPREILGLGSATKVDRLEIHWPSGQIDKFKELAAGAYLQIKEGEGLVFPRP